MNSIKKLLLICIALTTFSALAYNLVWSPEWQAKVWPESRLRAIYIAAMVRHAFGAFDPAAKSTVEWLGGYAAEIEKSIFQRVLISVGGTLVVVAAFNFLPLLIRGDKNERLRGSQLASVGQLKRLVWWREHRKTVCILFVYVVLGVAVSVILALRTGSPFSFFAVVFALGLFVAAQFFSAGTLRSAPKIRIGNVPIPRELEGRHILVEGTTGAGKSQAIYQIVAAARARGDRGLIMDIGSACAKRFKRTQDLCLAFAVNDSLKWNPFLEVRSAFDYAEMARAAIPEGAGSGKSWHENARLLFMTVFQKLYESGDHSIAKLLYYVNHAPMEELGPFIQGTAAAVFGQKNNETVLQNTRSVAVSCLHSWSFLPDNGDFSIREWIRKSQPGQWLFIQYKADQIAAIRQLLACWLQLAITETLSLDEDRTVPTWFIADEFDTLGQLSAAKDALTNLRRFNGRCVFGVQTVAQYWSTYGRDLAQVLLSCLSTKLYLRAGDPETAEYCSKSLGDQEILRSEQSRSQRGVLGLGGDPSHSSADRHVTQKLALPSELEHLPDLVGYLSIAGDFPIAKIKIPVFRR